MSLDFTAIDFETANSYRGSPCSVGLAKVRGGQVVDELYTLIRPPERYANFERFNTWLHGIRAETVEHSPPWRDALTSIVAFTGGDTMVCHNAGFDVGVIRYACIADAIHWPTIDFMCTLVLARHCYSLPSYGLPFVAARCGVILGQHHLASDDARGAALIAVAMARLRGVDTLEALAERCEVRIGHMETGTYSPSVCLRPAASHGLIRHDANPNADPDHLFHDRVIVFTGTLMSMTRQMAWDQTTRAGGIPEPNVTKHTNVLVIGDINPGVLAPGKLTTGKTAKVFALQHKGQDIELMTEDDFLRSL